MDTQTIPAESDTLVPGSEATDAGAGGDLSIRSYGEQLWLWRLRLRSTSGKATGRGGTGMSQAEAAAFLAVDRGLYASAEKDQCSVRDALGVLREAYSRRTPTIPTAGELCALARRRSGMRLADVEAVLGLTRPAYLAAEASGDERVVALWRGKGYQF